LIIQETFKENFMLNKRIAQISLSLVTLFNVALPNKSWAESLPVKGSAANASIEDLKTPEIDFDKLNVEFAGKLKELQTQAVKLNDQKIVAPDYKRAQAVFREQLAEGVQYYLNDLAIIKKDTEKVLKKSFSRIKAIKAASDAAKTGETIDDNALRMTLDAEKRSLLETMKTLQGQNNARYSNALLNLRDFKAGGLGVSPYLTKRLIKDDFVYRSYDELAVVRTVLDKKEFRLDCNFTVFSEQSKEKQNITYLYFLILNENGTTDAYGTSSLAPIRLSKKVKAGEWMSDEDLNRYTSRERIPNWKFAKGDCSNSENRISDTIPGQGRVLRFNLNPIGFCDSQLCVNMLMKDIIDWQNYVDTLPQEINMESVLQNVQGQSKVDGTVVITNTKNKTKTPFIFQSLLDFAKHTFSKPVLTPNTATSLPEAGGKILEKSANMFGGVVAGIAAAPVAIFEGTIGALAVAISDALDIEVAELSLDISNNYPYTNGAYLIDLSRMYGNHYMKQQKLPTILVDNSTQDQDEE
jgi:hypothetical protein